MEWKYQVLTDAKRISACQYITEINWKSINHQLVTYKASIRNQ